MPPASGVDRAGFVSRQLVAWATPIAWRGFNRPLQETDLPGTPKLLRAADGTSASLDVDICELGAKLWAEEIAKARKVGKKPSLFMVWMRLAPLQWWLGTALGFVCGVTSTGVVKPVRELHAKYVEQLRHLYSKHKHRMGEEWATRRDRLYLEDEALPGEAPGAVKKAQ